MRLHSSISSDRKVGEAKRQGQITFYHFFPRASNSYPGDIPSLDNVTSSFRDSIRPIFFLLTLSPLFGQLNYQPIFLNEVLLLLHID